MKIAVWHNLPSGGGKRALFDHVKGLTSRGHFIEAWCPPMADQSYMPLSDLIPEHVVPIKWPISNFSDQKLSGYSRYRATRGMLNAMEAHCENCVERIQEKDFELILVATCQNFAVSPIGRYAKIPSVLYLQEPFRLLYEALPNLPWQAISSNHRHKWSPKYIKMFINNLVEVQGLRIQVREEVRNAEAYSLILVNSHFSRESTLRAYGIDSDVCYLGVDLHVFTNRKLAKEEFVMGIGAIAPHKNIRFVIESISKVREPRPEIIWVGNMGWPAYINELTDFAKSIGVKIEFKIQISDDELVNLLNKARILVYAPRLEPFGFAPIEANACGTPVVAVAEGGVRETIIDGVTGILVENDTWEMAKAVQCILSDEIFAKMLGENGVEYVQRNWSIEGATERLEKKLFCSLQND